MNFPTPPTFNDPLLDQSLLDQSIANPQNPAGLRQQSAQSQSLNSQQAPLGPPRDLYQQNVPPQVPLPPLGPGLVPLQPPQVQQFPHLSPHQLPPQYLPPPHLVVMNGMNGAANMPAGAMVGLPTQVAQQAELHYIYGMVEELSRQLAENKRALEDVVAGVGRVRQRARANSMGNEELIDAAVDDIHAQESNMDTLVSLLTEALEKAKFSRDANAALLSQYASVVATMLKQFHEYKVKHVTDVTIWHRSYRAQLAEARAENSKLREQIWEMQEHAGRANELIRGFRSKFDEDKAQREMAIENKALRQEVRFWKRMAMPEVPDDDPSWSDDDDLIDPVEKIEQERKAHERAMAAVAAASDVESGEESDGSLPSQLGPAARRQGMVQNSVGGVPMQREDPGNANTPTPPPRPGSAGSTASSTQ